MFSIFNEGLYISVFNSFNFSQNQAYMYPVTLIIAILIVGVGAYLLGSINSAIIVSRLFFREDVRSQGSGNAGTTNVMRSYGKKAAIFTLLGDMLKTVIAILFGGLVLGLNYAGYGFSYGYGGYIAAFACVLGHVYPIFYGFKGGKGVLCLATAVLMLSPIALVLLFLVFILIVAFTKYVSLGSVVGALLYPILLNRLIVLLGPVVTQEGNVVPLDGVQTLISMLLGLFIAFCHRENIKRLMRGEEHKFSFHSKKK